MTDYADLVKELGGWTAGKSDDSKRNTWLMHKAASVIEALVKERDEARAKTATMLGVGDGTGNLFVYGDYDSIKAAQAYIFRAEAAQAEIAKWHGEVLRMQALLLELHETNKACVANNEALRGTLRYLKVQAENGTLHPQVVIQNARAALEAK